MGKAKKNKGKNKKKSRFYQKSPQRAISFQAPFPDKYSAKMTYSDSVTIDASAGFGVHFFTQNGIYDCDISGTGNQPQHYDTLSQVYEHYQVVSSKCTVTFINANGLQNPALCVLVPVDETASWTGIIPLSEKAYSCQKVLQSNATAPMKLSCAISTKKQAGQANIMQMEKLQGFTGNVGTGSNPAEVYYWAIAIGQLSTPLAGCSVLAQVKLEYNVVFFDRKDKTTID